MIKKTIAFITLLATVLSMAVCTTFTVSADEYPNYEDINIKDTSADYALYDYCDNVYSVETGEATAFSYPDSGVTVLIFYCADGCWNSYALFSELPGQSWTDDVNIVAMDVSRQSRDYVADYLDDLGVSDLIDYSYYSTGNNAVFMALLYSEFVTNGGDMSGVSGIGGSINTSFVLVIRHEDDGNYIKCALSGVSSADRIAEQLAKLDDTGSGAQYLDSGLKSIPKMSAEEIRRLLSENNDEMPPDDGIFDEYPSVIAPYAPGKVNESLLIKTTNRFNALRAIAGLPDVELDLGLCEKAQYGAVLIAASEFSHYPSKPDDMDDDFFNIGAGATRTSNLSGGRTLLETPAGFMDDSDNYNIDRLGHRRWQLNPRLGKIGFGYALGGYYGSYTVEKIFDQSGAGGEYDFIAWPSSGNFPVNLMDYQTAWSVSFDQGQYGYSRDSVRVTLTCEETGETWEFSNGGSDGYFNVDFGGYGVSNCIIFRPDLSSWYDGEYTVEVSGLKRNGGDVTVRYKVNFFCPHEGLVATEEQEATCTADGNIAYWYCYDCGRYFADADATEEITRDQTEVGAYGHDFVIETVEATCTDAGYTKYTCARCGYSYVTDEDAPLGHNWGDWKVTLHATETEPGEEVRYCLFDPSHVETRTTPALGFGNPFTDVPAGSWFEQSALWCNARGYITGTGATTFAPATALTRGMFVQILARVAIGDGLDNYAYGGKFTDVKATAWYAKSVQWAIDNGVTGGTSATTFSPNAQVTREQLAAFFMAYARSEGYDVSAAADLDGYTDAWLISPWAVEALEWAVAEGLISGTAPTKVAPKLSATRAQAAVIFKNFVEIYVAKQK